MISDSLRSSPIVSGRCCTASVVTVTGILHQCLLHCVSATFLIPKGVQDTSERWPLFHQSPGGFTVGETFRHALNILAAVAPEWCLSHLQPEWIERYDHRVEDYRLPKGEEARLALALVIGADGTTLLNAIYAADAPIWLREIPAVQTLRRVWIQKYFWEDGIHRWRSKEDLPPAALFISSPYDLDAAYNKKRTLLWVGYKAHFTEACDDGAPHLITHVETTKASVTDDAVTERIHEALKEKQLLPDKHVVDTGYLDAKLLVTSQQTYRVDLLGPTRDDYHWQAREGKGFAAKHFVVD